MAHEYIGYPDQVGHVEDAEHPLAAVVASISSLSIEAVQHSLEAGGMPDPIKERRKLRFEGQDIVVTFDPVSLVGAVREDGIIDRIKQQFAEGDAVALYHKTGQTAESPYSWTLLLGHLLDGDEQGAVQALDPRHEHVDYYAPHKMRKIILNSTTEGSEGIYAFAVNTEPIEAPSPVA